MSRLIWYTYATVIISGLIPTGVGAQSISSCLFVGDSITFHPPYPEIGWYGSWGMAASAMDKDYVHQVAHRISEGQGGRVPSLNVYGVGTVSVALTGLGTFTSHQADVIVVQLGENDKVSIDEFTRTYETLVAALDGPQNPRIVCTGVWIGPGSGLPYDPNSDIGQKEAAIQNIARKYGCGFFSSAPLATWANCARDQPNSGVAWHPSDAGMAAYADAIMAALPTPEPTTMGLFLAGSLIFQMRHGTIVRVRK